MKVYLMFIYKVTSENKSYEKLQRMVRIKKLSFALSIKIFKLVKKYYKKIAENSHTRRGREGRGGDLFFLILWLS